MRDADSEPSRAIDIAGDVTSASEDAADGGLHGRASAAGAKTIVLNFSGLDYMNSGGIGLLVTLLVRVQRQGQRADSPAASATTTARSSS